MQTTNYKLQITRSQIPLEVLPAPGLERLRFPIRADQPHPRGSCGPPDPRHSNSRHLGGDRRRGRKEQFVIVAAMQRELERDPLFPQSNLRPRRSEERRVGEEGKTLW